MKFLLLLLLSPLSLFAVTITVINDSEYNLEARIYDPNKELVTSFNIPLMGTITHGRIVSKKPQTGPKAPLSSASIALGVRSMGKSPMSPTR